MNKMERKIRMDYQLEISFFFLGMLPGYVIALFFGIAINNVKLMVIFGPIFGFVIGFAFYEIFRYKRKTRLLLKQDYLMYLLLMGFIALGLSILFYYII